MIVECPYCHMTLLDQFNGQFRCWWCHIWLRKDQVVILGENKGTYLDTADSEGLLRPEDAGDQDTPVQFRVG
jgi:hypothetical protein